ncbi:MAG: tetratricopeptide repeat protein [Proteobacteria bacterium]|nr:tetratricopeptide repeat protein [Pseudomonadota bacterium]
MDTENIKLAIEQAIALYEQDRLNEAKHALLNIQSQHPDIPYVLHLLALIALKTKRPIEAVLHLEKAVIAEPKSPDLYALLGAAYMQTDRLEAAANAYQKAAFLDPKVAEIQYNMGNTMSALYRWHEAIKFYQRAVELQPNFSAAYFNLGTAFKGAKRLNKSIAAYRKVLTLDPKDMIALCNIGKLLLEQNKPEEAVATLRSAIAQKPDNADLHFNLGNALKALKQRSDAIASYQKALQINPEHAFSAAHLLELMEHIADWSDMEDLRHKVEASTKTALQTGDKMPVTCFAQITRCDDPAKNFVIAKAHCREITAKIPSLNTKFPKDNKRSPDSKITIGYLSNDFFDHATAHLMLGLFGLHNREDFNIFTFSHGTNDNSQYRAKIIEDSDKFFDISEASDQEAAKRIYDSGVDILIDLKGHTQYNRLQIFAFRPAPLQVAYLGFPGTTGADFMDYILTDKIVSPEDHAAFFSEKIVYLPHCYQVNNNKQEISDAPIARADFGLPENGFIFSSFNNTYKIEPVMFDVWMNLLKKIPNSVLWLVKRNDLTECNLKNEANARGVDGDRLIFAEHMPKEEHLARSQLVDLALDTRICGGHTTTSDALWSGVPVVVLQGNHFASRVSSSILAAIGLPELVTRSLEDYETLCLKLQQNPDELKALKAKLAQNRLTEPLFDTPRFTKNLESAFHQMWKNYLSGNQPSRIDVIEK